MSSSRPKNFLKPLHMNIQTNRNTDNPDPDLCFIESSWFRQINGEYRLVGTRCNHCGKTSFPVKPHCPACHEKEQQEVPLSRSGILHTFAQSVMGPRDLPKPYLIGFIDLPEGIKLYSILADCDPWDEVLKIGMEMTMEIAPIKTDAAGNKILGYRFVPARQGKEAK